MPQFTLEGRQNVENIFNLFTFMNISIRKHAYVFLLSSHLRLSLQTLIPSTHLTFDVERVISSNEGSLIALAGPRGICILELPRRWGASGQFMQGKLQITCRPWTPPTHCTSTSARSTFSSLDFISLSKINYWRQHCKGRVAQSNGGVKNYDNSRTYRKRVTQLKTLLQLRREQHFLKNFEMVLVNVFKYDNYYIMLMLK
uniref:Uncharacterized protein n=1 Tax=Glossina brevipalpis TaxID=37001 RepID=A0A1A9WCP2_9MUSC